MVQRGLEGLMPWRKEVLDLRGIVTWRELSRNDKPWIWTMNGNTNI